MVDDSKRLSGSPKIRPKSDFMKKWMSEPNLLGDDEDDSWIRERDNMEENRISFTEEVPELKLEHINKQRVQLRPKRRPPTRDFVRSRASMDFDAFAPEEIKDEGKEEKTRQVEADKAGEDSEDVEVTAGNTVERDPPSKPKPPPKPASGFRLPDPGDEVVLRKTTKPVEDDGVAEAKVTNESHEQQQEPSSPEKKYKDLKRRFKAPFTRFRRSGKRKHENGDAGSSEPKTNLTRVNAQSMDTGLRPLGDESGRRWWNRHRRKTDEKGLHWILGIFHHRKNAQQHEGDTRDGGHSTNAPDRVPNSPNVLPTISEDATVHEEDATRNDEDVPTNYDREKNSNGKVTEVNYEKSNVVMRESNGNEAKPESVSNLRQKFERISAIF